MNFGTALSSACTVFFTFFAIVVLAIQTLVSVFQWIFRTLRESTVIRCVVVALLLSGFQLGLFWVQATFCHTATSRSQCDTTSLVSWCVIERVVSVFWDLVRNALLMGSPVCLAANTVQLALVNHYISFWGAVAIGSRDWIISSLGFDRVVKRKRK
jgi:hypothetical protein